MLFPDVNVLLHAYRSDDSPENLALHDWLAAALTGPTPVAVSEAVLSSVVRIATHSRVFKDPAPPSGALGFCDAVLAAPSARVVRPGSRHWAHFRTLVSDLRLRGNDVPDAYLAALALEHGATFVTRDRGFARFGTLRILDPLS